MQLSVSMSRRRKHPAGEVGYYHVMSRVCGGEALLGSLEKEVLRRLLWRVAEFSGVTVVTYALMDNHFHVVLGVPPAPGELSDGELVRRYGALYPQPTRWNPVSPSHLAEILARGGTQAQRWRRALLGRMHDVSWFARTLKQRFSRWFNAAHERKGTLWSERFKGVLLEKGRALRAASAYVDLNAVRAGLAADPKDYRFCGYGEACAGSARAREGLKAAAKDLAAYRVALFGRGQRAKEGAARIGREEALRVLQERGKLPLAQLLRLRVRYFSEGRVLGSREFVRRMAGAEGGRPPRAVPLEGAEWEGVASLGGLRQRLFR